MCEDTTVLTFLIFITDDIDNNPLWGLHVILGLEADRFDWNLWKGRNVYQGSTGGDFLIPERKVLLTI